MCVLSLSCPLISNVQIVYSATLLLRYNMVRSISKHVSCYQKVPAFIEAGHLKLKHIGVKRIQVKS